MIEQKTINNAFRYVLDLLEKVNHYPYHNINHTLEVYGRVSYLCDKEFVYLQDKTDALMAALFHDTGFTKQYYQNEKVGADIARDYLEKICFREDRIKKIEGMIMSTIVFTEPKNKLEQIIQDADFDNLGRKDCMVKTMNLKKELALIPKIEVSLEKWILTSYNLIRQHKYHTKTAKKDRDKVKKENIKKFEERLKIQAI